MKEFRQAKILLYNLQRCRYQNLLKINQKRRWFPVIFKFSNQTYFQTAQLNYLCRFKKRII